MRATTMVENLGQASDFLLPIEIRGEMSKMSERKQNLGPNRTFAILTRESGAGTGAGSPII